MIVDSRVGKERNESTTRSDDVLEGGNVGPGPIGGFLDEVSRKCARGEGLIMPGVHGRLLIS